MGFPIWLNCIFLGALVTFPLLLTVLSAEVLLDPSQVPQSPWWVMMHTICFWTHIHLLPHLFARSLLQLPRQIVPSSVKLQVLVPLKSFVADLTNEPICSQKTLGGQGYNLSIRVWRHTHITIHTTKLKSQSHKKINEVQFRVWVNNRRTQTWVTREVSLFLWWLLSLSCWWWRQVLLRVTGSNFSSVAWGSTGFTRCRSQIWHVLLHYLLLLLLLLMLLVEHKTLHLHIYLRVLATYKAVL